MRQLNARHASPEDKEGVIRTLKWCKKHGLNLEGLPYDDPLAGPDGIHLVLLAPMNATSQACASALDEGYVRSDVVYHSTLRCPVHWFVEADYQIDPALIEKDSDAPAP
jgi:hypothetical protein